MRNPNPIVEDNLKKYGKPPTWEQIESLIKESGISSIYHFEKYYGIVFNHLAKVRCGERQLSRSYWHFFYERVLPERGVAFTTPNTITKKIPKVIPQKPLITNIVTPTVPVLNVYKTIVSETLDVANVPDKIKDEHDRTNNLK